MLWLSRFISISLSSALYNHLFIQICNPVSSLVATEAAEVLRHNCRLFEQNVVKSMREGYNCGKCVL